MTKQRTLVQFGAGNIGRSLVAQLFSLAGWRVVFLDVSRPIIDALNARGSYQITVKDDLLPGQAGTIEVGNVSGVHLDDRRGVVQALAEADLAGSSVGAANLESVCSLLAQALPLRTAPLSVLLCENLHDASKIALSHMRKLLASGNFATSLSFVEAAISKMVPATPRKVRERDPLAVWAEAYNTLYLDKDTYIGATPVVPGVAWRSGFAAYVDRKLFLHNFGHAAAAYAGCLAGKRFVWECMEDTAVREQTAGCMMEASRGLASRHADVFTFDENRAWADDLLRRFGNRSLGDSVFRVGRDLGRKLAPNDRCIGAIRMLRDEGVDYTHTARALAAAMFFAATDEDGNAFPGDAEIVAMAAREGPERVLGRCCGMDGREDGELIERIASEYRALHP